MRAPGISLISFVYLFFRRYMPGNVYVYVPYERAALMTQVRFDIVSDEVSDSRSDYARNHSKLS